MGFKDMVAADRAIFIDFEYFGETAVIDGQEITVVVDDNALKQRQGGQELTIAESTIMLYAKAEELPKRYTPGQGINYNGRECIVDDVADDMGIVTLTLTQNRIS